MDEQKRKQLQDAMTQRSNLENSFVGMPTTKVVLKLGEHDDTISQLSQELGVGDRTSTPLGQGFMADVVDREQEIADQSTKPFVPTMTEPIQRYSQPEAAPTSTETPEYELYGPAKPEQNDGGAGSGYVNLYDDIPTMEDIEAAYQAAKPAPYTSGVEGGDIGIDVINDYGENNKVGFDDMAKVLTNIYENPDETEKILFANGFDSLGELKGKMQEDGHLFDYLDLTGKLEGMGYEKPKVDDGAAFVMDNKYRYKWEYISEDEYITEYEANVRIDALNHTLESIQQDIAENTFVYSVIPLFASKDHEVGRKIDELEKREQNILGKISDMERSLNQSQKEEQAYEEWKNGDEVKQYDILYEYADEGVDPKKANDIVSMALTESGGEGEKYAENIELGMMDILITDYQERELTKEEAEELYYKEYEDDKTVIGLVISAVEGMVNPKEFVGLALDIANLAIEQDDTIEINKVLSSALQELLEESPDALGVLETRIEDIIKDKTVDEILDTFERFYFDVNNIQGGSYVEAKVSISLKKGFGEAPYVKWIRGIEKYDSYVFDSDNPVCRIGHI